MSKLKLALGLTAGLILPACQATTNSSETTSAKTATMQKATVAKITIVLKSIIFCASSRKERDNTAKDRCSNKAKLKKYWDKQNQTYCFDCKEEKEIIE